MSISEKLTTVAENIPKVFAAGENLGNKAGYEYGYAEGFEAGKNEGAELPELITPAEPKDIRKNRQAIGSDGVAITGTMPEHTSTTIGLSLENPIYNVEEGYHYGCTVSVRAEELIRVAPRADQSVLVKSDRGMYLTAVEVEPATEAYNQGVEQAKAECASKHFSAVVTGDGSTELTFHVPFEPDTLCVTCHDPDLRVVEGIMTIVQIEPCAFGQIAGSYCMTSGGGGSYVTGLNPLGTLSARYSRNAEGFVTIKNFVTTTTPATQGYFGNGVDYLITATKNLEKTDKERITEAIERLPTDPAKKYSIYISKAKKEAAFTDAEWAALIGTATAKKYTFSLF